MLANNAPASCTPPIRIAPIMIHSSAGSQPNASPARIGPTTGPAAAIAVKCPPSTTGTGAGM
jgi:hypothetical protein